MAQDGFFDPARIERVERRLQALEDAEAIRNLKARYAALCDRQYDADGIAALSERLDAYDPNSPVDQAVEAGTRFHVRLAELSGNHFFADVVDSAMTRLARARWLVARGDQAWHDHRAILDLIAARDADAAAERLRVHIVATHERLLDALDADARSLRTRGLAIVR